MGLRIGTNVGALSALRNVRTTGVQQLRNFEKLSSGLRIVRGSDDPSGLVIAEQLRGQLSAIQQASENTQNAYNMTNVADAALGQVADQLVNLRGNLVAALNTGALGPSAQRALQDSVNATLSAIDRIGATTRYGDQNLLNGSFSFNVTGASPELTNVDVQGGNFTGGFPTDIVVDVSSAATRAQATGVINATQTAEATFRIQGPLGTRDITVEAGATRDDVVAAINEFSDVTGVEATAAGEIRTREYGSEATLNLQNVRGTLAGITPGFERGTDIIARVDGAEAAGRGNTILAAGPLEAEITVQPETTGTFQFTVEGGGARFQIGPAVGPTDQVTLGIPAVSTTRLGATSNQGVLSDLRTGGAASIANDPGRGLAILDAASTEISRLRARIGSVASDVFEPNQSALGVAFENVSAATSRIRDANFAEEIANSVRLRLLREAGLTVLQQVNNNAGMALRLLA